MLKNSSCNFLSVSPTYNSFRILMYAIWMACHLPSIYSPVMLASIYHSHTDPSWVTAQSPISPTSLVFSIEASCRNFERLNLHRPVVQFVLCSDRRRSHMLLKLVKPSIWRDTLKILTCTGKNIFEESLNMHWIHKMSGSAGVTFSTIPNDSIPKRLT